MNPNRVIVVEDERIVALHLKQQLSKLGYDVVAVAASGETALQKMCALRPDVVLMDINLEGGMDGIETVARMPRDLGIPVIYLTAYSEEATLARARETVPYGYLVKPFSERELHATIQMALARRTADAEVRESEERFRSIFSAVTEGIFIVDAVSRTVNLVNEAGSTMLGYTPGELVGNTMDALSSGVPPYTTSEASQWIEKAVTTGEPQRLEWQSKSKDGRLLWTEVTVRFVKIGGRDAVVAVVRDVTKERATEAQLRHAQKMEAVGQLTGGIAHDFNNLLAIIQGNLELIRERTLHQPDLEEMTSEALHASQRGASLTRQLLAYSRKQPLTPAVLRLDRLLGNLAEMLKRTLGETIEIRTLVPPDLWEVQLDGNQLENALLNVAVNARDAMRDGGRLTLSAANRKVDADYVEQNADIDPGDYVMVSVTDTGTGIPKDILDRVLEPFFTTKPPGKGSGLGLSMVYGFLKQSGGHIKIYSEVGLGTTINLYLPRATRPGEERAPEPAAVLPQSRSGEIILVVEDEEGVRKFITRCLRSLGYSVLQAADGPEALRFLQGGQRIDLLLTDIALPKGMNGPAIASLALGRRPHLKVLFMSGFAGDAAGAGGVEPGVNLLNKPFRQAELASRVRAILDNGGTA